MPDYKVITAEHKKAVDGKHGPMQVIALALDVNGTIEGAEWFTKATTPVPAQGSILSGTLEDTAYGKKFKKEAAGGFGGGGGGGRQSDPKTQAMIVRQHSQTTALRYCELRQSQGKLPDKFEFGDLVKLIDWFDQDAKAAGEKAA